MTNLQKIALGIVAVIAVVAGYLSLSGSHALGDATVSNYPTWYYNGIVIGSDNTLLTNINFGTCSLTGTSSSASLATETLSCSAPKAKVGDTVFMMSPSTTGTATSTNGGFPIIGAKVNTAGTISVQVVNSTATTSAPTTGLTGVQYLDLR